MSRSRWAVSCFITWHLLSLAVRALPPPDLVPEADVAPRASREQSTGLTAALDSTARVLRTVALALGNLTRPVSRLSALYLNSIGFAQQWRMFSHPPTFDQYARIRYYVSSRTHGGGAANAERLVTELIVPAHPEDRVRLLRSYLDSTRDKAIMVALENFQTARQSLVLRSDMRPADLPDYVAPVTGYFARRFAADRLSPDERIVRTEFWYGVAPMSRPGDGSEALLRASRVGVLEQYYAGPIDVPRSSAKLPAYLAREREGDITWILDYYEES